MPTIPYPNVPMVSGVPILNRLRTSSSSSPVLSILNSAFWTAVDANAQWGIYDEFGNSIVDNGLSGAAGIVLAALGTQPILSTVGIEYGKETKVSDFPVEQGGFASYNKIELPAEPMVTLSYDGSEDRRAALLNALDFACKSTDLYSVVTPEVKYINYSITRYSYSRYASRGATLLIINVWLKEIRQVTAQFVSTSNAKNSNAEPTQNNGIVQPENAPGEF